jgi:hypothetical protein
MPTAHQHHHVCSEREAVRGDRQLGDQRVQGELRGVL